jgi:Protein of unknown function (DUF4435)
MTYLDEMISHGKTAESAWLFFVLEYTAGTLDIYLFVEGYGDLSYYLPIVRQHWRAKGLVNAYNCNGKDNVIGLMPKVKARLDQEWRGLFFIDKDLDDWCGVKCPQDRCCFCTECYSIENYLISRDTVKVIWMELMHLPAGDARLGECIAAFDVANTSLSVAMTYVMAWIIWLRRGGHKVVLNDVSMDNIITLDAECRCTLVAGWAEHILAASNTQGVTFAENLTADIVDELAQIDPKAYVRGKFELWWFIKFLNKVLLPKGKQTRTREQRSGTCSVNIAAKTAVDVLAPRLLPPSVLVAFLNQALPGST